MTTLADVYLRVRPDTKTFGPELDRKTTKSARDSGAKAGHTFGLSLAKAAGSVLAAGLVLKGAASVVGFLKDSTKAASDLNETANKSNVIFGKNAAAVNKWARTASTSFGLSRASALEAAASFGNMFQQLGIGGKQAVAMSTGVVKLAADLGSFNNLPTADVLERIQAALRGEYDSLQKVIPNINAARVEQVALNMTHKTAAKDLTAAEKAAAVYAIVTKDGAKATNDFAKTSGGLANQQKILKAKMDDVKASIGQALLPALTGLVTIVTGQVLPGLQALWQRVGPGVTKFFRTLALGVHALGTAFQGEGVTSDGFVGVMERVGVVLRSVAAFIQQNVLPRLRELWDMFITKGVPVLQKIYAQVLPAVQDALRSVQKALNDNKPALQELWNGFKKVVDILITKVLPILGPVLRFAFTLLGKSMAAIITLTAFLSRAFFASAKAVLLAISAILTGIGTFAKVMSKIPGPTQGVWKAVAKAVLGGRDAIDKARTAVERLNATKKPVIPVTAPGSAAVVDQLMRVRQAELAVINRTVQLHIAAKIDQFSNVWGHKAGARIPGYGGGDIVPAMLEPGETVVPKHLTAQFASQFAAAGIPGFQRGGRVGVTVNTSTSGTEGVINGLHRATALVNATASRLLAQDAAGMGALGGGNAGTGRFHTRGGWPPNTRGNSPPWYPHVAAAAAFVRRTWGIPVGSYVSAHGWSEGHRQHDRCAQPARVGDRERDRGVVREQPERVRHEVHHLESQVHAGRRLGSLYRDEQPAHKPRPPIVHEQGRNRS